LDAKTSKGLGTFCIPGTVVAIENSRDRIVVLWLQIDEKHVNVQYGSRLNSVFSPTGLCLLEEKAVNTQWNAQLMLEIFEFNTESKNWTTRSLVSGGIAPYG
jgi:hypothetical protein